MERAGFRKPPVLQPKHLLPGHALLASTAQCVPPEPQQSMPEYSQATDVSRDRVVVEVDWGEARFSMTILAPTQSSLSMSDFSLLATIRLSFLDFSYFHTQR